MEAMRLSLLEHEEHMRREAQNRNNNASDASNTRVEVTSTSLTVPGTSTSSYSDPISPSSSAPVSSTVSPSSSLSSGETPNRPESNSVTSAPTNSPPPGPGDPIAALQGMSDTTTSWRRRTSSPPPFTTLSAVMGAAATASAVLGSSQSTSAHAPRPNNTPHSSAEASHTTAKEGSGVGPSVEGDVLTSLRPPLGNQDISPYPIQLSDQTKGPNSTILPFSDTPDLTTAATTAIPSVVVDRDD